MIKDNNLEKYRNLLASKGYIKLSNYLVQDEFLMCKSLANYLEALPEEAGGVMKYFERSKKDNTELLNRAEKLIEVSSDFNLLINFKLNELVSKLAGQSYTLFKDKINFKMSGAGGFKAHQDAPAFQNFVQEEMFTIMIPLQPTTEINSCLYVANNFFKKSSIPHINGTIPDMHLRNIKWQAIEQDETDILLFSSYLIHYSADNLSSNSRRCYFITFNPKKCGNVRDSYFTYKRHNFPPRIERAKDNNYTKWQSNLAREIY